MNLRIYTHPQIQEQEIQRQIKDMLENNIIRESNSPYNSPLWIVPKKIDNSGQQKWRLVIATACVRAEQLAKAAVGQCPTIGAKAERAFPNVSFDIEDGN